MKTLTPAKQALLGRLVHGGMFIRGASVRAAKEMPEYVSLEDNGHASDSERWFAKLTIAGERKVSPEAAAKEIAARLQDRACRFCEDKITYDELHEGNAADWEEASSSPELHEAVLAILRNDLRSSGL